MQGYKSAAQEKNIAWVLPRPKPDRYKGGMPLYAEEWLLDLARELLGKQEVEILNLFCGMSKQGIRVDINKEVEPDFECDAHDLSFLRPLQFDVVLADPPYSNEEAKELYGIRIPLKYKVWTAEADRVLKDGGLLIVYHKYLMSNPNPAVFEVVKRVFIGNRIRHVPRVAIYFRKRGRW